MGSHGNHGWGHPSQGRGDGHPSEGRGDGTHPKEGGMGTHPKEGEMGTHPKEGGMGTHPKEGGMDPPLDLPVWSRFFSLNLHNSGWFKPISMISIPARLKFSQLSLSKGYEQRFISYPEIVCQKFLF